ncbi:MAG: adenosine deaminase [Dehalococcoidia bacterium]|nr:adenosine deaminase [Dehalococcoidia bacterium]
MDLLALPKTELHLHLEGAIPQQTLLQLVHKYGGVDEVPDLEALQAKFRYRDFAHFIATWIWMVEYLREYDDLQLIATGVARALIAQGVRYAELHFSPSDYERHGLRLQPLALAVRAGLHEAARQPGASLASRFGLILDLGRDNGPEQGMRWLEEAAEVAAEAGILGIGLGGSEQRFPPEPYEPVYQRAEALGLHRVAHAGEAAGPESIWGAIKALGVERIGHGTHAIEDPALMAYLVQERIPLEVCLTSNVQTGAVATLRDHPLATYLRAGIRVTLSSDDPTMFGSDIVAEYRQARDVLGLNDDDLIQVARTGFEVAFLSDVERSELLGGRSDGSRMA